MKPHELAVLLAVQAELDPAPANRIELLTAWQRKSESVKTAYLRRAKRLLKAWET